MPRTRRENAGQAGATGCRVVQPGGYAAAANCVEIVNDRTPLGRRAAGGRLPDRRGGQSCWDDNTALGGGSSPLPLLPPPRAAGGCWGDVVRADTPK